MIISYLSKVEISGLAFFGIIKIKGGKNESKGDRDALEENEFLEEYLPKYNEHFKVAPEKEKNLHREPLE